MYGNMSYKVLAWQLTWISERLTCGHDSAPVVRQDNVLRCFLNQGTTEHGRVFLWI
jgi:hypothetical protein